MEIKEKRLAMPKSLFERLASEKARSGINANSIIILALDKYLSEKEKAVKKWIQDGKTTKKK